MSGPVDAVKVSSPAELYALAYEIETDAVERYKLLADQMQAHNNSELNRIFLDLARAEGIHAAEIQRMAGERGLDAQRAPIGAWRTESPEAVDLAAAHYLLTPVEALQMALAGEERALAFYTGLAAEATDPAVKKLLKEFVAEETEHVELCHRLIRRYSTGSEHPEDLDPPWAVD
ncbi:MAG: ferritin family protein [Gammaproteobacteria bacterium]|nr:ferritin family protein [Gammaproteobacteria bacterium]